MLTRITMRPHQRVLVAEDHPGMSAAIRRLVVAGGFEVVGSVDDGAQVAEEAARLRPDIIVLDLNMPNRNGIDACRELTACHANENHRGHGRRPRTCQARRAGGRGVRVCRKAGDAY